MIKTIWMWLRSMWWRIRFFYEEKKTRKFLFVSIQLKWKKKLPLGIRRWSGLWLDVFDVRENAERGEDINDDCNKFGWNVDGDESFCSFLIVVDDDDGDKIKFEFVCFVWSIRILFVILAAPFESIDDGEWFISCLHVVELIINDGNGWESVDEVKSSVLIRKAEDVVEEIESVES